MKKILLISCLILSMGAFAQSGASFKEIKHSFGNIKQNVPATYVFTFTNTAAKPLVIETATAQCGCTTPVYSKEAIPKGTSSTIKVTYNAANPGAFTKTVTVKFANVDAPTILTIEGTVDPAEKAKSK
jgi:hypothetical protein